MKEPIKLLEKELDTYLCSKEKSIKAYERGRITIETHNVHLTNLSKLINEFSKAIKILKININ